MKSKQNGLSRRLVLKGAGASLALPLLPSLLTPSEAAAQSAVQRRSYVHFATHHGGIWGRNMFPALPTSGVQTQQVAGREIRAFPLRPQTSNGQASLSPVLTASSTALTERIASKMFVLQGVDVPWNLGHHTGGHLGNFARNDGGGDGSIAQSRAQRRTIDQVMGWSPAFYGDLSLVRERVMVLGRQVSYNYADPVNRTGGLQEIVESAVSPLQLFDKLFPQRPSSGSGARPLIVDRVYENYRRLRDSGRLSQADRLRLEQHMHRVDELQRRLTVSVACGDVPRPTTNPYSSVHAGWVTWNQPYALDPNAHAGYFKALTDVIVLALSCGVSRVASIRVDPHFSTFSGDWHQEVAHQSDVPDGVKQNVLVAAHQRFFADVMVNLAQKLDAVDTGDGMTLLDHTLSVWTQECGNHIHQSESMPIVAFGSAGGFLRTGQACDYRNLPVVYNPGGAEKRVPGLLWHQWLGTVLQAMGIPRSEWENASVNRGYPDYKYANLSWIGANITVDQAYPESVWSMAGDVLPWLKA